MPDTTLSPTGLVQVEVGASEDTWGDKLNANSGIVNGFFDAGPALKLVNGGTGATTASQARTNLGLGTMATQAAGAVAITGGTVANVAITGGSVSGITDLAIADGGTGASTAAAARTNLGLGTMATQNASAVAITGGTMAGVAVTGGSVSGITDLAVGDGGTGASSAAAARSNLGAAASGANSDITSLSALSTPLSAAQGGTGRTDNKAVALVTARTLALTGDMSGSASFDGSANATINATLDTVNGNTGTFGSATAIPVVTVNGKGLVTAVSTAALNLNSTMLGGGTASGGSVAVTGINAQYSRLAVVFVGASLSAEGAIDLQYSTNNGGSWTSFVSTGNEVSATAHYGRAHIYNTNITAGNLVWGDLLSDGGSGTKRTPVFTPGAAINALRAVPTAGSFDAGAIYFLAF